MDYLGVLPALPRARLHGARARQRVRAPAGPARGGRRDRDLRVEDAGRRERRRSSATGTRRATTCSSTTWSHAFVQAMERGLGQARQHRHRPGDEREPPLPAARRHHRVHGGAGARPAARRASFGGSRSTSRARPARSGGSRGRTWRTGSPRPSRSSRASEGRAVRSGLVGWDRRRLERFIHGRSAVRSRHERRSPLRLNGLVLRPLGLFGTPLPIRDGSGSSGWG